jgi:hypothetical protein
MRVVTALFAAALLWAHPAAAQEATRGDVLYRMTLLRAAPGRLLDLVAAVKGTTPWIYRHSQGDHWDLMVLEAAGSDLQHLEAAAVAPLGSDQLVAWREEEFVRGPDLAALPEVATAGLAHIEMFHALPGKRAELLRQREMENAYLAATGRPRNAIFVRELGASWDAFTLGVYRSWSHYAEGQGASGEREDAAARAAGFAASNQIGPYLRTLIQDHHDTLAVPVPAGAGRVVPWQPAGLSSPQFESHAAFDPLTGDLYFVRSSPEFSGWRILVSRCTPEGWSQAMPAAFAGAGVEADPFFTAGGRTLYFISTRATGGTTSKDLDLWRVERSADGKWGTPVRLPEPLNSSAAEWFPRPGADGWLYFGSARPGGLGGNDIWRGRADGAGRWTVENLGPAVNTAGEEYEPLPSADGSRLIVMAADGLYETRRTASGWSPRVKLGPEVNQDRGEIGALFSPSGRSLLFSRDTKAPLSGEFFVWHEGGDEDWPPACPAVRR